MRVILILFLGLVACGGGGDPVPTPVAIDAFDVEQPDIVLLSVSGRNLDLLNFFCPPECNEPYLGSPDRAGGVLATELTTAGFNVEARHYIAAMDSYDDDGDREPDRLGCLKLIQDLRWIHENWVEGQLTPTQVIIVGHSHGCVWAHNVVSALPEIPIDVLISLDGVSTQWESDHEDSIGDYYGSQGGNPFVVDLRDVTDVWSGRDTKDVVFDNVAFNIEVRSDNDCTFCLFDDVNNERLDGSFAGVVSLESDGEDHSGITREGSVGMLFVIDQLLTNLLVP